MLRLKGYLITLGVGYMLVFLVNAILSWCKVCDISVLFCFYYPMLIILAFFALDFLAAGLVRLIPKRNININSKLFRCFSFERKLYEKLGVKWFKDKIPELGGALKGFSKSEISGDDASYFEEFIKETILGEITHVLCILFGIAIFFKERQQIGNVSERFHHGQRSGDSAGEWFVGESGSAQSRPDRHCPHAGMG